MKNPVASLVRSVVKWFRSNHRISQELKSTHPHPTLTPEEFRRMFQETIANDPEMVRQILRPLVGAVIPIVAGACSNAQDIGGTTAAQRTFGEQCGNPDFYFPARVGIGTTSPEQQLHLYDGGNDVAMRIEAGEDASASMELKNDAKTWIVRTNGSDNFVVRESGVADRITVEPGGNVGIGTNNPSAQLHVESGGSTRILNKGNAETDGLVGVDVDSTARKWSLGAKGTNESGAFILFDTTASQRRLTVDSSGRFGFGTSSPAEKIDVAGNAKVSGNLAVDTNTLFVNSSTDRVGIGTTSPDSKLDVRGSVNKIVFLRAQGSPNDDGDMINDAIDALPDDGGIIYLLPGTYNIKTTVRNGSKKAVKIRGFGGAAIDQHAGLTTLKWDNSNTDSLKRVVKLESNTTADFWDDFALADLTIDGNDPAGTNSSAALIGLYLNRIANSKFNNVQIQNMRQTGSSTTPSMGIKMTSLNGAANKNSAWNLFLNCSVWRADRCIVVTGESTGGQANSSHNMFVGFSIGYYAELDTNAGLWLGDCDNNCFIRGWIFAIPQGGSAVGPGVWIDDPDKARANYFYHLQPATGSGSNISFWVRNADTGNPPNSKNLIFGYDLENGQGQPRAWNDGTEITSMTDIAKFLFWVDSKGTIRGS